MSTSAGGAPARPELPVDLGEPVERRLTDELEWHAASVRGDFSGQVAANVEITESHLVDARLVGVEVERLHVTDAIFDDCDLSGALLTEAVLTRVELRRCRMSGLVIAGARLRDVSFVECKLDDANLRMTTSERVEFDRTILRAADFYAAVLGSARFFDCDLTMAQFSKAELRDARLHGSTLDGVLGAESFAGVTIDSGQIVPLGLRLFAALGISVEDDRAPLTPPDSAGPRR